MNNFVPEISKDRRTCVTACYPSFNWQKKIRKEKEKTCNIKKKNIRLNKNWPKSEINYSFWNVFPLYIFLQRIFETCFPFFFLSTGRSFQELLPSYLILLLISFFNFFSLIARLEIYIFFSFLFLPSYIFRYFRCSIDNVTRRIEKRIASIVSWKSFRNR